MNYKALVKKNKDLKKKLKTAYKQIQLIRKSSEAQLQIQNNVLVSLAKSEALKKGDLKIVIKEITQAATHTLDIELCEIWLYNTDKTILGNIGGYQLSEKKHSGHIQLRENCNYSTFIESIDTLDKKNQLIAKNYSSYFNALESDRLIATDDAHLDHRTKEWSPGFLTTYNINSLMNATIRLSGKMIGVFCCGARGDAREWTLAEQSFIASLADFISLAIEANEYKMIEAEVKKYNLRNELTLNSAINGFCRISTQGDILKVNYAMCDLLNLTQEEIVGQNIYEISHMLPATEMRVHINRALKSTNDRFEMTIFDKKGQKKYLEVSTNYVKIDDDQFYFSFFSDITLQKQAYKKIYRREHELENKNNSLIELNSALKVILKKREEDKIEVEEKVISNIRDLVLPYLEKTKRFQLDDQVVTYLNMLEANLQDIVSPFSMALSSMFHNLTQTEIQVANLVKAGKTTLEISDIMNLSDKTIEVHRKHIRSKLGIQKKKINLRTYLISLNSTQRRPL